MRRGAPPSTWVRRIVCSGCTRLVFLRLLLLSCLSACAPTQREALDHIYPPGADRTTATKQTQRQQSELVFSRQRNPHTGRLELPTELRQAASSRLSAAVGYDAYHVRVRRGQGYSATWKTYCDYVFFDASGKIVEAYRREGRC